MSYTTVAELRSALGVGSLYQDSVLQSVCDAADNVLIPFLWTNSTPVIGHSNTTNTGTSYFQDNVQEVFYVGQSLVFTGCGSKHNGNKTLTGVGEYSVTYAITGNNNVATPYHPINPYGSAAADTYVDYSTVPAVQEASLMLAIAIWQARQAPSGQGMSVDGFTPSPFTMSNTLLARVRGLLAPYLAPGSMVG
jgi:flagellar basal body rod protein FlgC